VPDLARPAQDQIDERVLAEAELIIAIFKGLAGTPTGEYPGTTMYEMDMMLRAGKGVMAYFHRNAPVDGIDGDQRSRLAQIKTWCGRGRYGEYDSLDTLGVDLREQLDLQLQNSPRLKGILRRQPPGVGTPAVGNVPPGSTLSETARALLFAAAEGVGNFIRSRGFQGTVYQVGETVLCDGKSNREGVRWDAGLKELDDRALVTAGPGRRVFNLTDAGYKLAEAMGARIPDDAA
jgi:hypothetical protein